MNISEADLAAVRAVLRGDANATLSHVGPNYSTKRATLVAITILMAVGLTSFDRGQYGLWLQKLVRDPGEPAGGWPHTGERPRWWYLKYAQDLQRTSSRVKLHTTRRPSLEVRLNPAPQLDDLLEEDPAYRQRAAALYQQIFHPDKLAAPKAPLSTDAHAQLGQELRDLYGRLGNLLARHFPETPQ